MFNQTNQTQRMTLTEQDTYFLQMAIDVARTGMNTGKGGPFGAVVVHIMAR
jgi:tRNA(Arg) A34 adenosine deaminase TadA